MGRAVCTRYREHKQTEIIKATQDNQPHIKQIWNPDRSIRTDTKGKHIEKIPHIQVQQRQPTNE
jgi:hypothetical protein